MDPLCRAVHDRPDPACRCNEYAKVRNHERQQLRKAAEVAYRKATPPDERRGAISEIEALLADAMAD